MTNDPVVRQALTDLDSADLAKRIEALQRLRPLKDKDAQLAPKLIPLLHDPSPEIRRLAAQVLSKNGDNGVVPALIDALLYDQEAHVRAAAVDALAQLGDRAAVAALIDALYDDALDVRFAAASALGRLGDPRAVIDLIRILDSDDYPLGMMAAQALLQIGTPEALAAIQHLKVGDHYNFDVPSHLDTTLAHIDRPTEPEAPPQSLEETVRRLDHKQFDDYLAEAESETVERGGAAPPTDSVQFSAYAPREIQPNTWQPLRAYVFLTSAATDVSADAQTQLGALFSSYRTVERPATSTIAEGALITATPTLDGFQFNPPSAQQAFFDAYERFDFKLRAVTAPLDQASNGRITFSVEGVIVADIPLSIYVGASATVPASSAASVSVTRPLYQAIFCSYSRQDTQIVERIERAYKALGLEFMRDVESLKSGQDWSEELLNLIDRADIFQLFWSQAAAQSQAVKIEWEHALSLKRQDKGFIRPVYWQQPMPAVPPELAPINFAYEPDLGQA